MTFRHSTRRGARGLPTDTASGAERVHPALTNLGAPTGAENSPEAASLALRGLRLVGLLALLSGLASCDPAPPDGIVEDLLDARAEVVASGYVIPWAIDVIGEDEFLFTERLGRLIHVLNGEAVALDGIPRTLSVEVAGLTYGGLMDVSLHPAFATNGQVYVTYVNTSGRMAVARFDFSDRTVRDFDIVFQSNAFSIGSRIAWQDDDTFFVTQGLGGTPYPEPGAQDLAYDGGKIHRLQVDGKIPSENPTFEGQIAPTSIWSYGHRDPQGLVFDRRQRRLYSTEHGPLGGDEFNEIVRGGNYGWPLFSNGLNYDETPVSYMTEEEARQTTVLPLKHWDSDFTVAPAGLLQLEGSQVPEWDGTFLIGSLAQQQLLAFDIASGRTSILLANAGRVRDVAQLPSGRLLIAIDAGSPGASDTGRIVRLEPR